MEDEIVMSDNNFFGANDNALIVTHRSRKSNVQDEGDGEDKETQMTTYKKQMNIDNEVGDGMDTENISISDDDDDVIDDIVEMMQTPGNQTTNPMTTDNIVPAPIYIEDIFDDIGTKPMVEEDEVPAISPMAIANQLVLREILVNDDDIKVNDSNDNDSVSLALSEVLSPTDEPVEYKIVVTPVGVVDTLTTIIQKHAAATRGGDDGIDSEEDMK
eukprot:UN07811